MRKTKSIFNRTVFFVGLLVINVTWFLTLSFKKRWETEDGLFRYKEPLAVDPSLNMCAASEGKASKREKLQWTLETKAEQKDIFTVPWPNDPQCCKFTIKFGHSLPLIFLFSYPRSGNTWTRYMLESASGIYTGTVYSEEPMKREFEGETEPITSGRTLAVKIHPAAYYRDYESDAYYRSTPKVLLLRRPGDSILSYWDLRQAFQVGRRNESLFYIAPEATYRSEEFQKFFDEQMQKFEKDMSNVIETSELLHVMFYENLVKNPISEIRGLMKRLQVFIDEERLECLRKHIEGVAKRNYTVRMYGALLSV